MSLLIKKVPLETRLVNGVTALMVEQEMVQRTHLVEATDMGQRPSSSRSEIQRVHSIDRRMQQSQLGLGYVMCSGACRDNSQQKAGWALLESTGLLLAPLKWHWCSARAQQVLLWCEKCNREFHVANGNLQPARLLKIKYAAKPRWLGQLSPKTVSNSSSFRIFNY